MIAAHQPLDPVELGEDGLAVVTIGTGEITEVPDCVVTSYRELDTLLGAYGQRIASKTVSKLYSIARHPVTCVDPGPRTEIDGYTWRSGPAPRPIPPTTCG